MKIIFNILSTCDDDYFIEFGGAAEEAMDDWLLQILFYQDHFHSINKNMSRPQQFST